MAGGTRRPALDVQRAFRDPPNPAVTRPQMYPRSINIAWAAIADGDIMPGELVVNRNDNSLVWRKDETNIYRFDNVIGRTV